MIYSVTVPRDFLTRPRLRNYDGSNCLVTSVHVLTLTHIYLSVQACQGTELDDGVDFVEGVDTVDSPSPDKAALSEGIKFMPDSLVVTASVPGQ